MSGIPNRVLFIVPDSIYLLFASQTPSSIWERFENRWALKIVPRPRDVSINPGEDTLGNTVVTDYSPRTGFASYEFNLRFDLYAFYKVLQSLQVLNSTPGTQAQIEMIDFVNPDQSDTLPNNGVIRGFTRRFGVITDLEVIGSTSVFFTNNFVNPPGEFLKSYRCQGTSFVFQERGIPAPMTLTAPAGTLAIQPLPDEVNVQYLGGENIRDGFTDTFVTVERSRLEVRVNTRLENIDQLNTLVALRDSQVDGNGVFTAATLNYPPFGTISGVIRQVRSLGGIELKTNKTTFAQEEGTQGYSFIFTQI